ncbi:hypothetical protein [Streptomyces olivochromogenes]|uniref:hypothetical protein n=1 Tax=Streptomyces olivochromogenes TaxID=1963 RepID=UPI001F37E65B|nr:hypothetical protein [Streptomyces olivochromogenes]MCF3136829.1 hypothetical protein [Streptomyces olivochromogenes]
MTESTERLIPTGQCFCGCGETVGLGSFFARGHDKTAEAALLAIRYGSSVARLLDHHGFGPKRSVLDAAVAEGGWVICQSCEYAGAPASVRNHCRKYNH